MNHEKRIKDVTVRSVLSSNVYKMIGFRMSSVGTVGKLEHVILQHQKITIVILQKNNVTYYVSINRKEKGIEKIVSLIKKTI